MCVAVEPRTLVRATLESNHEVRGMFDYKAFRSDLSYILRHREIDPTSGRDYKMTKARLAKRLGVQTTTIWYWLKGQKRPSATHILEVMGWANELRRQQSQSSVVSIS